MPATLQQPATGVRQSPRGGLTVDRSDISFHNVDVDRVAIAVTVRNRGATTSRATRLRLQAAPLGVFVPWQRLTSLPVPELRAGESATVTAEVRAPRARPLGAFSRVPPQDVVTALGGDQPRRRVLPVPKPLRKWLRSRRSRTDEDAGSGPELPADPFSLVRRRNPHWAGNIHVLVGNTAVERHLAHSLRIYPGRVNLVTFIVGGTSDAYMFDLGGDGAKWDAALYDRTDRGTLRIDERSDSSIPQSVWVQADHQLLVVLAFSPPAGCREGDLLVHVTQHSTRKKATVEFSVNADAQGPGCYAV